MFMRMLSAYSIGAALLATTSLANAAVIVFQNDLAGFQAAGGPGIAIDFDSLSGNIAGNTIAGVTFGSPDGNSLDVVAGLSTFTPATFNGGSVIDANTNRLFPTSGANVLSPGGLSLDPGPLPTQQDSLVLDFATAQAAVGIDVLFQSFDFLPFVSFAVFGPTLDLIASGSVSGAGGGPGGSPAAAKFLGFLSGDPSTNIRRIVLTEGDGDANFPDSNVGYDSLRFAAPAVDPDPTPTPEPASLALFGMGVFAMWRLRSGRGKAG